MPRRLPSAGQPPAKNSRAGVPAGRVTAIRVSRRVSRAAQAARA
ncbi:MAG TPA: hypothetical protein VKV80_02280 [Streptosporangiaceae bacterium]|nr:hypothetical protein [Streptosporangiaceae bacterium]